MAALTDQQRRSIWAEFMRRASRDRQDLGLTKTQLRAALDAADVRLEANSNADHASLPPQAAALSSRQRSLLFLMTMTKRFEVN